MKEDILYLKHILDAVSRIEEYKKDKTQKDFMDTTLLQDGIIRQIEIIGEATKRVSQKLKSQNSHVPWKDIAGMRDKLIHGYFGVDLEAVWKTAKEDIPLLRKEIKKILEDGNKKSQSKGC